MSCFFFFNKSLYFLLQPLAYLKHKSNQKAELGACAHGGMGTPVWATGNCNGRNEVTGMKGQKIQSPQVGGSVYLAKT